MIYQGSKGYLVTEIMLHTAALRTGQGDNWSADKLRSVIRGWHVDRGWRREGYHAMIPLDGGLALGRTFDQIGAGARGHNRGVLHVCLANHTGHTGIKTFPTYFTGDQRKTLMAFLQVLLVAGGGAIDKISGHNEVDNKECPGFRVQDDVQIQALLGAKGRA